MNRVVRIGFHCSVMSSRTNGVAVGTQERLRSSRRCRARPQYARLPRRHKHVPRLLAGLQGAPVGQKAAPEPVVSIVPGPFTPALGKHSKNFSLEDSLPIGIDRMQRNFDPLKRQIEEWHGRQLSTTVAKLIIYQAFIDEELEVPKHPARRVHELYFQPTCPEFEPRTLWSLSNAFTSASKDLEPIPQYKATAKLAGFLEAARLS